MPEFLYKIQPTRPEMLTEGGTAEEDALVGRHFNWLKENSEAGIVLLAGRTTNTDPSSFGIVIFRAESEEAAQAFAAQDPAVLGGVFRSELYPYRVALLSESYPVGQA
jgi:uncharacterized protein YciI